MKNKRFWILPGVILLVSLAFLLLNFRVSVSRTEATRLIVTMGEDMQNPLQRNDKISLVLVGEGPLVRALQKHWRRKWKKPE